MFKKGDTLIEVMLAIGIFSMIAISVVAVMNGGTSGAQTALETTLARDEIDAQAEALRWVHDSYINDKNSGNSSLPSVALWRQITNNAIELSGEKEEDDAIINAPVTSCPNFSENYDSSSPIDSHAFILDTRSLGTKPIEFDGRMSQPAYIPASRGEPPFTLASTYPHLIYGSASQDDGLIADNTTASSALQRVEGIYIIAVKDRNTTQVVDIHGQTVKTDDPAFYDFYIRTCWYGSDDDMPSTISTVIRLHNPDVTTEAQIFDYCVDGGSCSKDRIIARTEKDRPILEEWPRGYEEGWTFDGWCIGDVSGGKWVRDERTGVPGYYDGICTGTWINASGGSFITDQIGQTFRIIRMFTHTKYTITYNSNGSSWKRDNQICYQDENSNCIVQADGIERSGYEFMGWCTGDVNTEYGTCNGTVYRKGDIVPIPDGFDSNRNLALKAIWRESNRIITIRADWTSNTDYDSKMKLSPPGGGENDYVEAYYGTRDIKVKYHDQEYSLVTGLGDGQGNGWQYSNSIKYEEFVINTLGGRYYYYSIRRYPNGNVGNDITIKVTVKNPENNTSTTTTYYSRDMGCTGNYWNVFGYVDGRMVTRNTCSSSIEYGYGKQQ